ncbi:Translation initiation factor IF-3 [Kiritimatiella glycovorans]|uniref:Translation initiation factor IF-3 n=2 Tax=Kiritimatiella glycovorans TaxID=1307763 RepID=A0A0G3ELK2_9BACT|nr:Translation initiation factor IF-3 [Kiritimatiella glycovorans]
MNRNIRVPEVRLTGVKGEQIGVVQTRQAQRMADDAGLDLVEIAPTARPPVCRIMDYGKYKYEQDKKRKEAKKSQSQTKVKEVKFHVNVGDHDYETKLRHAREFIEDGNRVKGSLYFRGRENAHRDLGFDVMNRFVEDLSDIGTPEQKPRLMGRQIITLIVPAKKKGGGKGRESGKGE